MRIERLSFQAFGPYIKRQDLAFHELSQHHLFLMRGQTGAGKTAILDAITYALFGKSSGGDRGDFEKMRCRGASADESTFVELIFSLHGKRYRFYREIVVGRKRNGEELYKVNVNGGEYDNDVFLPFYENCKRTLLDEKAEALIGLSHAQFIQVMMLPQGKFEKLLVSKSEEKQEILKTLFQTERWTHICDALSEQLKIKKATLEEQQRAMMTMLSSFDVSSLEELDTLTSEQEAKLIEVQEVVAQKKQAQEQAHRIYEEQVQLHQWVQRQLELKKQQESLNNQKERMEKLRTDMKLQEEIARLRPYVEAQRLAISKEEVLRNKLEESKRAFTETKCMIDGLIKQEANITTLRMEVQTKEKELTICKENLSLWQQRTKLLAEQKELEQLVAKHQAGLISLKDAWNKGKQKEQQQMKEQEEISIQLELLPTYLKKEQILKELRQAIQQKVEAEKANEALKKQIQTQSDKLKQAKEEEQALKQAHDVAYQGYLSNSAALLSALLEDGSPCPVCGACLHPHHAQAMDSIVELQELNHKKEELETSIALRQTLEAWLIQANERLAESNKQLAQKQQVVEEITKQGYEISQYEDIKKQLEHLLTLQQRLPFYKQEMKSLREQLESLEQQQVQKEAMFQQASQQLLVLQAQIQERFAQLSEQSSLSALTMQCEQIETQLIQSKQTITDWEQSLRACEVKKSSLQATKEHLQEQWTQQVQLCDETTKTLEMENHQHITMEQLQMPRSSLSELMKELESFDTKVMQVEAALQEIQAQLHDRTLLKLEEVAMRLHEAEASYQTILRDMLERKNLCDRLKQVHTKIQTIRATYEMSMVSYTKQSDFVKALRGDTSIGIERYVLGIMLSSITQNANQLLRNVHGGRYQIYRSDEASGRTRKFGLELSIYDSYSCSMRSVVSLSGGEKFLVSLALSLALSTVVQARNGGVVMETMFIDEGFGSLDEQSISDALQILSTMACGKAMIGIISHVELLKENIPYGIEVTKGNKGSSCRLLV